MFVGHYAASLALKRLEPRVSLGLLFIAVQFVDILFFPLVMLGIEQLAIIPDYTASTHFALPFMPYTHSLLATIIWSGLAYLLIKKIGERNNRDLNLKSALAVGLAVGSHWVLDLIVHTPDLPLAGNETAKLGFGLWNNAPVTFSLEAVLLLLGLVIYLRSTQATSTLGKYGMIVFVVLMILVNVINIFGPPTGTGVVEVGISALASYGLFAAVAFWLDRHRQPAAVPSEV